MTTCGARDDDVDDIHDDDNDDNDHLMTDAVATQDNEQPLEAETLQGGAHSSTLSVAAVLFDLFDVLLEFVNAPVYEEDDDDHEEEASSANNSLEVGDTLRETLEHDDAEGESDDDDDDDKEQQQQQSTDAAMMASSSADEEISITEERTQTHVGTCSAETPIEPATSPLAVAHDDDDNSSSSSVFGQPTHWRRAVLYCLRAKPGQPCRHLAPIPFVTGVVFLTAFLWTRTDHSHWTFRTLQILLGAWSVGPTTMTLWYIPLTRPPFWHHTQHHDVLIYLHVLVPLFVLVMVVDLTWALIMVVAMVIAISNSSHAPRGSHHDLALVVLTLLHVTILALATMEPALQAYHHHCISIPFYPFCLCYWCCPRFFRACHRCVCRCPCCRCYRCRRGRTAQRTP